MLVEGGQTVHPLVQVGDLRLEIADGRVDRVETVMDWARKNDVGEEAVQALLRFFGSDENGPNRDWRLSAQPPVIGRAARVAARARGEQLDKRLGAAHSASLLRAFEGANARLVVLLEAHAWERVSGVACCSRALTASRGRKHDYDNWRKRVYQPVARKVELPKPRPYDLRGSYVSLLAAEGYTLLEVSRYAGHSVQTCETYYAKIFDDVDPANRLPAEQAIRAAR